ncbi:hypothetical protein [Piscinibacter koreensis]|uniref:Uncharacterized protein n=1 Tax=Piscinibacter koreensis TaxID=2742824 RepID=A0A7Y6NS15_9BURK|nr:hypothetical protein [Schlegelella koreensis]NUZ08265.1 hypothetical protein [Schlegelella koreensis]
MQTLPRDRITIDLQGLRAALVERANAAGQSPSELVRQLLAAALGRGGPADIAAPALPEHHARRARARVFLRMSCDDAVLLRDRARRAGMPPGEYVATLIAEVPAVAAATSCTDQRAALIASTAELATLSRSLSQLNAVLRRGSVPALQEYRAALEALLVDVRRHLALASGALAGLEPPRGRRGAASANQLT